MQQPLLVFQLLACFVDQKNYLLFYYLLFIIYFYLLFVIVCILTLFLQDTQRQQVVPYPLRLYFFGRVHNHLLFIIYLLFVIVCIFNLTVSSSYLSAAIAAGSTSWYSTHKHNNATTTPCFSHCLLACLLTNKIFSSFCLLFIVYFFFFFFFIVVVVVLLRLHIFN